MSKELVESNRDLRRHALMADLAEQAAKLAIEKMGVNEEQAIEFGNDLADFLAHHWNGQSIYINSDAKYQLSKRDMEIFARFGRNNANELAKEFNISYVRIYQIYKRCLLVARRRNQPALFDDNFGPDKLHGNSSEPEHGND